MRYLFTLYIYIYIYICFLNKTRQFPILNVIKLVFEWHTRVISVIKSKQLYSLIVNLHVFIALFRTTEMDWYFMQSQHTIHLDYHRWFQSGKMFTPALSLFTKIYRPLSFVFKQTGACARLKELYCIVLLSRKWKCLR